MLADGSLKRCYFFLLKFYIEDQSKRKFFCRGRDSNPDLWGVDRPGQGIYHCWTHTLTQCATVTPPRLVGKCWAKYFTQQALFKTAHSFCIFFQFSLLRMPKSLKKVHNSGDQLQRAVTNRLPRENLQIPPDNLLVKIKGQFLPFLKKTLAPAYFLPCQYAYFFNF